MLGERKFGEVEPVRVAKTEEIPPVHTFGDWLSFLWDERRRWIRTALLALIVSVIVAFAIPPMYKSTVRLMPPDQGGASMGRLLLGSLSGGGGTDGLAALAGDALGMKTPGAVIMGILRSRTVEDDIINQFDLRSVYWKKTYISTRKKLDSRTDVSEDKKSGIITISVEDHDAKRAHDIAQMYVDEVNAKVASLTTSSAHRERVFLEGRLTAVKQDLDQASAKLSQFSSKNRTFDPATQARATLEAAAGLQVQLIQAETELRSLSEVYSADNVRVKAAQARVSELRRKAGELAGTSANSDGMYPSLSELPLLGNSYYDLYRRVKIEEAVFETLTKQYELAKVQEAKEIPTIKVLDLPEYAEKKSWPPRTIIVVLGMTLGAIVGMFLCLMDTGSKLLHPDSSLQAVSRWVRERRESRAFRFLTES